MQKRSVGVIFTTILFLSLVLSGCGDTTGKVPAAGTESFTFGGSLYVTNGDGSLLVFDPLSTNKGATKAVFDPIVQDENIVPSRRFPEAVTGPTGVFLDRVNDTLYVANTGQNAISIYDNASTLAAPFSATGVISGDKTMLDQPFGVTFDATNNRIFVANKDGNSIVVFEKGCAGATDLTGNIKPCRILMGTEDPGSEEPAEFPLDLPRALAIDTTRDILYISNMGNDSILVYKNAGTIGGLASDCERDETGKTNFDPCNQPPDQVISPRIVIGIVSVTNGSTSVIGDKTQFTQNIQVGDKIRINLVEVEVSVIHSDTNLTLADPYTGTTASKMTVFLLENVSKLELPFSLFIDSLNDNLYVVNAGINTPGVFIYEEVSTRLADDIIPGSIIPDRIISGLKTQLTVPTGIDVDVATGQIYVINNNSPNNLNQAGGNDDSPSLIIFNDIDTVCTIAMPIPCNIAPNRRIGGDVSAEVNTTLSSPTGIAFDPVKELIYITNTGANNIFIFSSSGAISGDIAPLKTNAGIKKLSGGKNFDNTSLEEPGDFHYDAELDRLFVTNFGSNAAVPVLVYDKVSTLSFNESAPSWSIGGNPINGDANFKVLRGFHVDKNRGYLLVLSASASSSFGSKFSIFCIPDALDNFNANCPTNKRQWRTTESGLPDIDFPTNDVTGPAGKELLPPNVLLTFTDVSSEGPTAMEVDEASGDVYVADKVSDSIFVYSLKDNPPSLKPDRTITGGLVDPSGLSYDATRDILYVTNAGDHTLLAFDGVSTKTNTSGAITPTRIVSTTTINVAENDKLKTPIAPHIDATANSLFLLSSVNDAIFVYDNADKLDNKNDPSVKIIPNRKITGAKTLFDFTSPQDNRTTGALFVAEKNGSQSIFVAQPESPLCPKDSNGNVIAPATCPPGALLIFGVEGKVPPSTVWFGSDAFFKTPTAVAVDTTIRNVLYVANQSTDTLSIFKKANEVDVFSTGKTDRSDIQLNRPAGLFVDTSRNRLYVSNSGSNTILAFDEADTLDDGNPTTPESITDQLNDPRGITVDTSLNRLYVANTGGNSIVTFSVNGSASLDFVLSGANTQLASPIAVAIDTIRDDLYVLNNGATEILVFEDISTRNGNVAPSRTISGSDAAGNNFMSTPSAIFIDSAKDLLYVTDRDADAVYFFTNASTAQGQAEHTTLSGDNTGLNKPSALFVDTTTGSP